ncbi:APC family permease [Kibdelosporangium phytohabitans]|uniref:Amino acid transporter n=1 Tax=Kibdelosporangium phytohabitans TaxID=860235 RepID=A0A0N7F3S0_9PSEU|nr:APC family permease [Kibdelosporangium phytohabitans]ALG09407.1 amino acid transporter [Kibdelosporangium phytohabitans]MBE1469318.1 amino acid transporter [Kibdelosporangium phytohabitans]
MGMTVRGAAFLGIGSMVGAGIFALLGEAGATAGSAVWLSFLLAGVIALLQGYAVAGLGARYPSSGGIVTYLLKGFGRGHITSVTSWLLYFAALIVTAMVSVSFGHYGSALFTGGSPGWARVLTAAVVVVATVVNIAGATSIDRLQTVVVVVMLAVFAVFVVVTFAGIDLSLLAPSTYPPAVHVVSSVALTFFAYLGFAVVSFTGAELPDPARSLPRAMYLSLGITILLYVLIALGVFGTLTVPQVVENGETALAVAVEPALGTAGFMMMALVAMLGTASSVNANLFAATGSTAELAGSGTFPKVFGSRARIGGTRGLVISAGVVLLMANLVDLTAIASLGSAVALIIFLVTSVAAFRLRSATGSRAWPLVAGIALTALVLIVFAVQTARTEPATLVAMAGVVVLAVAMDLVWRWLRRSHP